MSFLRLLTTGKSLVGLKEGNRYRVSRQRLLPRFEARANPFVTVSRPGNEVSAPASVKTSEPARDASASPAEPKLGVGGKLGQWFGRKRQSAQPATADTGSLVQAELSLEKVTVIRNDLTDSDLEIVTARPAQPEPAPGNITPDGSQAETLEVAESAWSRVSARFFGVGKS